MALGHIVGVAEHHDGVILGQTVHRHLGLIVVAGPIARGGIAIPAVQESWFDGQVQHHVLTAVVIAGVLLEFRCLVEGFDVLHGLGWQLAHQVIAAKEALAAHRQADGFTVPPQFTLGIGFHARQLLDEFIQAGTLLQPEGRRVEHDGVAVHRKPFSIAGDLDHLQHLRGHLQLDGADVERVLAAVSQRHDVFLLVVIAQHGHCQLSTSIDIEREAAQ